MELIKDRMLKNPRSLLSFDKAEDMWGFSFNYCLENRGNELADIWAGVCIAADRDIIPEKDFIKEYLWCVYVSGFRAATVAKFYKDLLKVHGILDSKDNYISIKESNLDSYNMSDILSVFNNRRKAEAVQLIRASICSSGYKSFHDKYIKDRDPEKLKELHFIGPALSKHLARNLGNKYVVKPDVHLNRVAAKYGFENAQTMCESLAGNLPAGFVDLVLWIGSVDNGTK